uniref:Uncharacterized protein n=1 Tax=Cyclophora tenuis TaxID=216820 RepID=A0A7S1D307_CYCTE
MDPNLWGDDDWPPYASSVILEIHRLIGGMADETLYPSDFGFRLIYNGQVLTALMSGCPADRELCDIHVLMDRVRPMARRDNPECHNSLQQQQQQHPTRSATKMVSLLSQSAGGIILMIAVVLVSALLGGVGTVWYLTTRTRRRRRSAHARNYNYSNNNYDTITFVEDEEVFEIPKIQVV